MDLMRIIALILLSLLPTDSQGGFYFRCPLHPCLCESGDLGIVMNCRQRFLTRIPPIIPSKLVFQELSLKKNNIRHLAAEAFRGIKVKRIDLSENIISKIDENAFVGVEDILEELVLQVYNLDGLPLKSLGKLRTLRVLHVISCKAPVLMNSTFESLSNLEELRLISCGIDSVEPDAFLGLEKTLRILDLFGNDLQVVPSDALGRLDRTEKLVFTGNKLKEIDKGAFWGMDKLVHLELSSNSIFRLHPHAFDGVHTYLEFLGLQRNHLNSKDLLALKMLRNLDQVELAYNQIENIPRHLFRRLNVVTLIGLQANKIQEINQQTFMGTERELKVLLLSANEVNTIAPNTFQGFRKLRHLYLDRTHAGNGLSRHSFKGLGGSLQTLNMQRSGFTASGFEAIMDLSELKTLVLRDNQISFLPSLVFTKLHRLTRLDLQGNELESLSKPQTFQGLEKSLRQLVLSNNLIHSLSECVFHGFELLRDIVLNQNPLRCDCQISWLKRWVISRTSKFSRNTLNWVCTGPPLHAGKLFKNVRDAEMTCPDGYIRKTCDNQTYPTLPNEQSTKANPLTPSTDISSLIASSTKTSENNIHQHQSQSAKDERKENMTNSKDKNSKASLSVTHINLIATEHEDNAKSTSSLTNWTMTTLDEIHNHETSTRIDTRSETTKYVPSPLKPRTGSSRIIAYDGVSIVLGRAIVASKKSNVLSTSESITADGTYPDELLAKQIENSIESVNENDIENKLLDESKAKHRLKMVDSVEIDHFLNLTSAAASGRMKSSSRGVESDTENIASSNKPDQEHRDKTKSFSTPKLTENISPWEAENISLWQAENISLWQAVAGDESSKNETKLVTEQNSRTTEASVLKATTEITDNVPMVTDNVPMVTDNVPMVTDNVPMVTDNVPMVTRESMTASTTVENASKGSAKMHNTTYAENINVTYKVRLEGYQDNMVTEPVTASTAQNNSSDLVNMTTSHAALIATQTTQSNGKVLPEVYLPTTVQRTAKGKISSHSTTTNFNIVNTTDYSFSKDYSETSVKISPTQDGKISGSSGQTKPYDQSVTRKRLVSSTASIIVPVLVRHSQTSEQLVKHFVKITDSIKYTKSIGSTRFPSPTAAHDPTSVVKPSTPTSIDPNSDGENKFSHVPSPTRELLPLIRERDSNKRYRYQDLYSNYLLKSTMRTTRKVADPPNNTGNVADGHGDALVAVEKRLTTEKRSTTISKSSLGTSVPTLSTVNSPTVTFKWKFWIPGSWNSTKRLSASDITRQPFDEKTLYGKDSPIFVRTVPPITQKAGVKRIIKNPYSKEEMEHKYLYTGSPRSFDESISVIKNWLNSAWGIEERRNFAYIKKWTRRPTQNPEPRVYNGNRVRNPYEKFKNSTKISSKVNPEKPLDQRHNPPDVQGSIELKRHGESPKSWPHTDKKNYDDPDTKKDTERTGEVFDRISGPRSRDENIITNRGSGSTWEKKQKGGSIFQKMDLAPKPKESNNGAQLDQQKNGKEIDRINGSQLLDRNTSVDITETREAAEKDVGENPSDTRVVTERPAPTKSLSTPPSKVSFNNDSFTNSSSDMEKEGDDPHRITPTESKIERLAINNFEMFINAVPYASNAAKVTWNVSHGSAVTGFRVSHGNVKNMSMIDGPLLGGTVRTYDLTSLVPEEEYKFCVTAYLSEADIRHKSKCEETKIEFNEEFSSTVSTREKTKTLALIIGSYAAGALVLVTLLLAIALLVRRYRDKSKTGLYVPRASPYWIDFLCGGLATSRYSTAVLDSSTATVSSGVEMSENDSHSDSDESGTYSFEYCHRSLPAQHIWSTADLHTNLYTYQ